MSKIRTVVQLQESLDKDWSWRIQEIAALKDAVHSAKGVESRTLVRAGIALL
jgi:hypothetical protein